jgi:hypothetical protein
MRDSIEDGDEMMVRLVPCRVRECRYALIDRERDRDITNKKRKEEQSYNRIRTHCMRCPPD